MAHQTAGQMTSSMPWIRAVDEAGVRATQATAPTGAALQWKVFIWWLIYSNDPSFDRFCHYLC